MQRTNETIFEDKLEEVKDEVKKVEDKKEDSSDKEIIRMRKLAAQEF
ncbi:13778_t:CDS:2, partial [Dentiscutata erythropus]